MHNPAREESEFIFFKITTVINFKVRKKRKEKEEEEMENVLEKDPVGMESKSITS